MNTYLIIRKVIQDISLVLFVLVVLYVIFRAIGNPAIILLHGLKHPSPNELKIIEAELGPLAGPVNFHDFLIYLGDMLTFHFGKSVYSQESVALEVESALPYTLLLFGIAAVISFIIGIPAGIATSFLRGKKSETGLITTATILNSIPFFVLAILVFVYFAGYYHIFPLRAVFPITDITHPTLSGLGNAFYHLVMPITVLAVIEIMGHLLTTRAAMVSVLGEDFITTARAKGVKEGTIMFHHAARNAMVPISTRMALEFAFLMSGAVIVEVIFTLPGMGTLLYDAAIKDNITVAQGALFVITLFVILAYSLVDFIHAWIDPRIKV